MEEGRFDVLGAVSALEIGSAERSLWVVSILRPNRELTQRDIRERPSCLQGGVLLNCSRYAVSEIQNQVSCASLKVEIGRSRSIV